MELKGIDGGQLWGFLSAVGALVLADRYAQRHLLAPPGLHFDRSGTPILSMPGFNEVALVEALFGELQAQRAYYEGALGKINRPGDFTTLSFNQAAKNASEENGRILTGLVFCLKEKPFESTLCAANGAGHQNFVQSVRDVLALVQREHLQSALFTPWQRLYKVSAEMRRNLALGTRKLTLRLDPADERLYALRYSNPTTADDYRTELGAQALVVPAFSVLPVVPISSRDAVTVSSQRDKQRASVLFSWCLWAIPAEMDTIRSLLVAGVDDVADLRRRGAFAAFRAARVSGAKGKLSFAPTDGVW